LVARNNQGIVIKDIRYGGGDIVELKKKIDRFIKTGVSDKTKDAKAKSPRFRIKDDKLFRLKSMAKKMKDAERACKVKDAKVISRDSDKDFALFYKSKLDEAIDSGDKEEMKRWSQELIDHYTTDILKSMAKKMKDAPNKNSDMYERGYQCAQKFTYIPDFKTPQEKIDFEAGLKEGYKDKAQDSNSELTIGKHDDVPDSEFDKDELAKGIKVEMEHTNDPEVAKSIARDHLSEIKDYYTRLLKMEAEAKR
jgi:hypothetical protein